MQNFAKIVILVGLFLSPAYVSVSQADMRSDLEGIVRHYEETLRFNGMVLVAQGDEVIFERGVGYSNFEHSTAIDKEVPFRLASLTKQFTAAAIYALQQKGALSVEEPLSTYLPELKGGIGDRVTLKQMVNHRAGLARDIEELSDLGISKRYVKTSEIIQLVKDSELSFEPGSQFRYSNVGYSLLAAVVERVTGQSFKAATTSLLFEPRGMTRTMHDDFNTVVPGRAAGYLDLVDIRANAPYEDKSYVVGAGSIMSSAADLLIWARAVFKGDVFDEQQRRLLSSPEHGRYSLGWFVDDYSWQENGAEKTAEKIHHDGGSQGFASQLTYLEGHDVTIILLTNVIPNKLHQLNRQIIGQIIGAPEPLPAADKLSEILEVLWRDGVAPAVNYMASLRESENAGRLPGSFDLILTGRGYMDIHRPDEAMKIFELVSIDRPDWEYGHLFRGLVYAEERQYQDAYCAFKRSADVAPQSSNGKSEMAKIEHLISDKSCVAVN